LLFSHTKLQLTIRFHWALVHPLGSHNDSPGDTFIQQAEVKMNNTYSAN